MITLKDMLEINHYPVRLVDGLTNTEMTEIPKDSHRYVVTYFQVVCNELQMIVKKMGECKIYRIK